MKYLPVFSGIVCVFLIHGVYTEDGMECDSYEVDYINKGISSALEKYSEKPADHFMLTLIYNESYKRLTESVIQKPATKSACRKAAATLNRFRMIATDYDNVIHKMEEAKKDLALIQGSPDDTMHRQYVALKLETLLRFSTSIFEAKEALTKYQSFKMMQRRQHMMTASDNAAEEEEEEEVEEEDENENEEEEEEEDENE